LRAQCCGLGSGHTEARRGVGVARIGIDVDAKRAELSLALDWFKRRIAAGLSRQTTREELPHRDMDDGALLRTLRRRNRLLFCLARVCPGRRLLLKVAAY
jgi:hypothetical protein